MAEDLLVNIEVDSSKAKKGVDDLSKSLKANTKQTKMIQKELKRLEKEYKSIATAAKKLPKDELKKLEKETRKVSKATADMGKQFERTSKKVKVAEERISDTEVAAAALVTTLISLGSLDAPIKLANRLVLGANAMDNLVNKTIPAIAEIRRLTTQGMVRLAASTDNVRAAFRAAAPAVREQIMLFKGVQTVAVRSGDFVQKLNTAIRGIGSGASFAERGMRQWIELVTDTRERVVRISAAFRGVRDSIGGTIRFMENLRKAIFGTFGPSSGGAAQVNLFKKLMLELQFQTEMSAKAISSSLGGAITKVSTGLKTMTAAVVASGREFANTLIPEVDKFLKSGLGKAAETIRQTFVAAGPSIVAFSEKVETAADFLDKGLAKGLAGVLKLTVGTASQILDLSQKTGVLNKGLIGAVEASNLFGIGMLGLGSFIKSTDNQVLDFIGSAVQLAGVFSLGLGAALTFMIGTIGQFSIAIGDLLLGAMTRWEKKFEKVETITRAFEFTVKGFGKTLGEVAVGSLGFWNEQVDNMVNNTSFGAAETQKSIKILIAEGQALGLSAQQNAQILTRSADLAATTGRSLSETSLAVAKSLAGNSAALQSFGVFTDEAALSHSKYGKTIKGSIKELDAHAKALLITNSIFEQTIPIVGAANDQLNTITGSTAQLDAAIEALQVKLGSQNIIFTQLRRVQTAVIQGFNELPEVIFDIIGTMVDLFGVGFKVLGIFLQTVITLVTLKSAYEVLNIVLAKSIAAQSALNFVFGVAADKLKTEVVAVTNLKTAMQGLGKLFLEASKFSIAAFNTAIKTSIARVKTFTFGLFFTAAGWKTMIAGATAATAAMVRFTLAVVSNPLFIKATLIIGSIVLIVEAINELRAELKQLQPALEENGDTLKKNAGLFKQLGDIMKNVFRAGVNLAKVIVIGLLKIVRISQLVVLGYQKIGAAVTSNAKRMKELNKEGEKVVDQIVELERAGDGALIGLLSSFDDTAMAAEGAADSIGKVTEATQLLNDLAAERFDLKISSVNIGTLGTEFERISDAVTMAKFEFKALQNEAKAALADLAGEQVAENFSAAPKMLIEAIKRLKEAGKDTKKLEEISAKFSDAQLKRLDAEVKAIASIKAIQEKAGAITLDQQKQQLQAQNKIVEKINLETTAKIRQLEELKKGLSVLGKDVSVRRKQLEVIDQARVAIGKQAEAAKKAALDKLTEKENAELEKQRNLLQRIRDSVGQLNLENLRSVGDTMGAAKAQAGLRVAELDTMLKQVEANENLTDSEKERIRAVIKAAKEAAKNAIPLDISIKDLFTDSKAISDFAKRFADQLANSLKNITVGDVFSGLGKIITTAMEAGAEFFKKVIDAPAFIDNITNFIDQIGNLPDAILGALGKLDKTILKLFDTLPEALNRFSEKLPELLERIIENLPKLLQNLRVVTRQIVKAILEALPDIAKILIDEISNIIRLLPEFIDDLLSAVEEIFAAIMERLPDIIKAIFEVLPSIIMRIIEAFVTVIESFVANVDEIVVAIVEGLIEGGTDLAIRFTDEFVFGGGMERLVGALLRLWPKVIMAFVNGVASGLQKAWKKIMGGTSFEGPLQELKEIPGKFTEGMKNLAKKATEEASELFRVLDINAQARGVEQAKKIKEAIDRGTDRFREVFTGLIEKWRQFWNFINTAIWKPFINALQNIWNFVEAIFMTIVNGLWGLWQFVSDTILGGFKKGFSWIEKLGSIVMSLFERPEWTRAFSSIVHTLSKAPGWLEDFINAIKDLLGFSFGGGGGGGGSGGVISGTGTSLDRYATGGIVARAMATGGIMPVNFNAVGTDTVPAMLTPGEFVMNTGSVSKFGQSFFESLNQGIMPSSGGGSINQSITVNVTTTASISEGEVRGRIVPAIKKELRQASLRGEIIMSPRGIL